MQIVLLMAVFAFVDELAKCTATDIGESGLVQFQIGAGCTREAPAIFFGMPARRFAAEARN